MRKENKHTMKGYNIQIKYKINIELNRNDVLSEVETNRIG